MGFNMTLKIDDEGLDDLPGGRAFVLGMEYEMIHSLLMKKIPFNKHVHSENGQRVRKMCEDICDGRKFTIEYMHEDPSENWMWLRVADEDGNFATWDGGPAN